MTEEESPSVGSRGGEAEPTMCTRDGMLCRVRFWTEAQWRALPPAERPPGAVHRPGSGWVAAVPVLSMN